ncbi:hypothetical protein C8A00DRAFT_37266 [Chaetomidium leptoderma]|uniref:WSC domain-containing protein n=1 Tax=Chaetomidium leptoderma TaxID=669021 RepID=A0AAN6VEW3_9PEZI|nr:hypothetical protein C8A00DRAFT_37266 [Chaetomidium leptoderma]
MKSMTLVTAALVAFAEGLPDKSPSVGKWTRGMLRRDTPPPMGVEQPILPPSLGVPTVQGCFKSSGDLEMVEVLLYNSIDECGGKRCLAQGYPAGGTSGGNQCWCGKTYPPKEDLVDDKNCNAKCTGYGEHACGGIDFWTIYNTGKILSVKHKGDENSSSKSSASSTPTPTSTAPEKTLVVSVTPSSEPTEEASSGGSNVAGIVAGVVVGVVVLASAIGGGYLYMRRKRNKEIEEEHRRNAAVSAFIGKPPGSSSGSMTDSRMDPVLAHRRMSDGSIADNQDYSRRILRVTN